MTIKNKDLCKVLYVVRDAITRFRLCEKVISQSTSGYTNLMSHLNTTHKDQFMEKYKEFMANKNASMDDFVTISSKVNNILEWMDWILEGNLPFEFLSWDCTQRNTKLKPITPKCLKEKMEKLQTCLDEKIKTLLPSKFGLVFDGWTDSNTHYLAVYAAIPNNFPILLWFSPFENEESLRADSYKESWDAVMEHYGKISSNITFVVGDNCSTNIKAARLYGVPIIGCASHRLNLAVEKWIESLLREKSLKKLTFFAEN